MLCVFADASQDVFAACAYVRQRKDNITYAINFIAAKSRVSPVKQLTIPRLELQAAVIPSRLAKPTVRSPWPGFRVHHQALNRSSLREWGKFKVTDPSTIRLRKYYQQVKQGSLTPKELQQADIYWIKQAQTTLYSRLDRGAFESFSPFKDKNGVIRAGGRVDEAIVSYETRHPALLPSNH